MTGKEYADLIAAYVMTNYSGCGIKVYREIRIGKSIIGKNRCVDILAVCEKSNEAFAIECKFQGVQGTADEKIPYALDDMAALRIDGCICYAGTGFSEGVLHMLQASEMAAYCMPTQDDYTPTKDTRELDHILAMHFKWWDALVGNKQPFQL